MVHSRAMKENLLVQYGSIRETIRSNVQTIGRLIEQAKKLKQLAEQIADNELKASMEEEVRNIDETIASLVQQTERLFDKYEEFVRLAFSK
jgi:hypothetical protein